VTGSTDNPLAIHVINDRMVVGGVATIIRMLCSGVEQRCGRATIWVNQTDEPLAGAPTQKLIGFGLRGFRKWLTLACALLPGRLLLAVWRDKREGRKPVIHLNTPYLSSAISAVTAARFTSTPLIYTVHANKTHISKTYWAIEMIIFRFAWKVVLELNASRKDYRRNDQSRVLFIPFGVKSENTRRQWRPRAARQFVFVAVNRLDPNRMVDIFIRAFALQMGGNDSLLHLIGNGAAKTELIALSNELGCSDRVRFFDSVAEPAIQDILVHCDCYLTLSAGGDVGMAAKLAAGVGIPVLAYEFDDSDELFYSASTVDRLGEKMQRIREQEQTEIADYAKRSTAALQCNAESMVENYIKLYTKAAK
jgi:glycosyltransferase involved in cell wall biosynthesis